jgi:hypothetical protein
MKYQRWYPTAVTLPNGKVLILSGTDQDSMAGPDGAGVTKQRATAPEVYDPTTDRNIALENARKLQNMYVRSFVVQTGPDQRDWKVLTIGEAQPPFPVGDELGGYDPWDYSGNTHFFDVQSALRDPDRNHPACQANCQHDCAAQCTKHWELVAVAASAHDSGAAVNLRYLNENGMPALQKVIAFGGSGAGGNTDVVEWLDLALSSRGELSTAGWQSDPSKAKLPFPLNQNLAAVMPDGNVVVTGGRGGGRNNLDVQIFEPATGTLTTVATMNVPRHDHSTITLLPDGSVLISGGNRVQLHPDRNTGVPVGQIYHPAYLFKGPRPEVKQAGKRMEYGKPYNATVDGKISQVALLRIGPTTHNWSWGNAYVRLDFEQRGRSLKIKAPAVPGAAVPGVYMLFVLDENGVPSMARRVLVGPGT